MVNSNQKNDKIKFCITGFFAIGYFSIMNNPKFIKRFSIKLNDEHIVYYGLIYMLLVYSTYKVIDRIMYKEEVLEHQTNGSPLKALNAKMKEIKAKEQKEEIDNNKGTTVQCSKMKNKILKNLEKNDRTNTIQEYVKAALKNKKDSDLCDEEEINECRDLDMSKFVHKDSIPSCDYVLPEQYNLYKNRKGYEPGDPSEDPTLDTIINKNNYIMFYICFVILLGIYAMVLIFKSIF